MLPSTSKINIKDLRAKARECFTNYKQGVVKGGSSDTKFSDSSGSESSSDTNGHFDTSVGENSNVSSGEKFGNKKDDMAENQERPNVSSQRDCQDSPRRHDSDNVSNTSSHANPAKFVAQVVKYRPGPLSKKLQLEIPPKPEELQVPVPSEKSTSTATSDQDIETKVTSTIPKRFVGPRSKRPKLEDVAETQISHSPIVSIAVDLDSVTGSEEISRVESDFPMTPSSTYSRSSACSDSSKKQQPLLSDKFTPLNRARPCPRSKKQDVYTTFQQNDKQNCSLDVQVGDLKSETSHSRLTQKTYSNCEEQTDKLKGSDGKISTITYSVQSDPLFQSKHEHSNLIQKWKKVFFKMQTETEPLDRINVIMDVFNTHELLDLQLIISNKKTLYLFEMILPHIWMNLPIKDLLSCRSVCKRWSSAVDNLLENHPFRYGRTGIDDDSEFLTNRPRSAFNREPFVDRYNTTYSAFQFTSTRKVNSFLKKVREHSRNPFVTRSVFVMTTLQQSDEELSEFWSSVTKLFRKHGSHIWHLRLEIQGHQTLRKTFKRISTFLELSTNLRSLELTCHPTDTTSWEPKEQPLPALSQLESLDLTNAKFSSAITGELLKSYGGTLKHLRVSVYRWKEDYVHLVNNLKEVHMIAMCSKENLLDLYNQLHSLRELNQLTKIVITVMVSLRVHSLFAILQKFKSLQAVKLILLENLGEQPYFRDSVSAEKDDSVCLPDVTCLELSLTSTQKSFRFLKWFPSLESLHLAVGRELADAMAIENTDRNSKSKEDKILRSIRRCIAHRSASKSSIWSLLPSLQILTVTKHEIYGKDNELCFYREMRK